ncbi:ABC transporter ATP-binding protein [Mangrovicoccus algicola]|uniref:ABC transporter ATP-binding protein n=1 Tax=Mangrovicoccus algicola TaxID=2771008 RepID=A0A8J7CW18_9RHOB|nr:ABC transporter ATP-binding protein [Mangrovicoccus algicola]MBE3637197.1 ABC transporter ATP-binding protein [Mangrovicoccus algicola]
MAARGCPVILERLSFGYGRGRLLEDISLSVRRGEVLALVGPNGSGKSTLLRLMAGLLQPVAGRVLICGENAARLSRRAYARRVALLSQQGGAPGAIRVRDLVAMGRFPHQGWLRRASAADRAAVAQAMEDAEVAALAGRPVNTLSGGQAQRARMAMTLAQGGDVLLLDEPTTYLDLRHQFGLLGRARRAAAEGRAVVAVLHDFSLASLYADRLAVLHEGRLDGIGPAAQVLDAAALARVFGVSARLLRDGPAIFPVPRD